MLKDIEDELLSAEDVAKLLKIGVRTVWEWSNSGIIPAPIQLGRLKRWRQSVIMEWIKKDCPDCLEEMRVRS